MNIFQRTSDTELQRLRSCLRAFEKPRKEESKVRACNRPSLNLLKEHGGEPVGALVEPSVLEQRLQEFGLKGKVVGIRRGPVVSRYEIRLAPGVRLAAVRSVVEDLEIALSGKVRILAPVPGTSLVGIEVINDKSATIGLRKVLETVKDERLPVCLGVDTAGIPKVLDLALMPHLLVAGQTGSGKSVFLSSVIVSLLYTRTPEQVRMVLVDPKRVEMAVYRNIPHLLRPVITEAGEAVEVFGWLVSEMERRYRLLEYRAVRNIEGYNAMKDGTMPYIICVVDEMADLMMTAGKELETLIVRLAQLARAVGIHLVLATQKPIVKVITGLIKSNMPSRVAFLVSSKTDSRVILDCNGAERLAGRGDLLLLAPGLQEPERYHGAWISDEEIKAVVREA